MADFTIRSENVNVEQIMRQIRMRIKEKRGVEYTEEEVRELANVKLEKFLNPRAVRSELVEHYRRQRSSTPPPENYGFEDTTLYESHRAPILQSVRRLLNPVLKLFFNPNPIIQALHKQSKLNAHFLKREELDVLSYEVLNNIVLELTRLSIEVKNLKMRIEAMSARQEFSERRARAFEGLVQATAGADSPTAGESPEGAGAEAEEGETRRRRRRRRGRRRPEGDAGRSSEARRVDHPAGERPPAPEGATEGPAGGGPSAPRTSEPDPGQ